MEPIYQFLSAVFCCLVTPLIYLVYRRQKRWLGAPNSTKCTVPQAGGAWPIIGHLHHFGPGQLTHKTLGTMANEHGPVFTIKLGSHTVLVVNSLEMAKECFTVHDKIFSTRPSLAASKLLGYDYAMFGFAPYGPYWRQMRKIATIELLSNRRIDMFKHIRASEIETTMKKLHDLCVQKGNEIGGVLVDMKQRFGDLTHNIALRMVGGKSCFGESTEFEESEARNCRRVTREFASLFGVFVLADAIPLLGWWDLNGYKKAMKRTAKELDVLVGGWLEEHKQKRAFFGGRENEEKDFMDSMLNILDDAKIDGFDADTIIKSTCLNLVLAGSDTTMVSLTWALSLLLNNPDKLKKAQDELDLVVGWARNVNESDIPNLLYLQSIVKETLRLYPPSPLILRAATDDCTLSSGHPITAETRLMVNVWKIHRDEHLWPRANEFLPERFLNNKNVDEQGRAMDPIKQNALEGSTTCLQTEQKSGSSELMAFGGGRRGCPGASLALQVVHLGLARFLHGFQVKTLFGGGQEVDMTESTGLTNLKATPLEVLIAPRLSSKLY